MKNLRNNRTAAVAVGAALLVGVGATGTAVADNMIGTRDIKKGAVHSSDIDDNGIHSRDIHDGTIKGKDIKKHVVGYSRLGRNVVDQLDTLGAIQEAKTGPQGPKGDKGDPGVALIKNATTAANSTYGDQAVKDVASIGATDALTAANSAALTDGIDLAEGKYLVHTTVQFFDLTTPASSPADDDTGVAALFLGSTAVAGSTLWAGTVPDDSANAAQSSASTIVDVPAGGAELTVRGALRDGDEGQAGANVIVTKIG